MRFLGIDPGLRITGYGCVDAPDPISLHLVEAGLFRLARSSPPPPIPDRLLELDRDLAAMIERLRPHAVAVEAVFAHQRHPATAIAMAHARGVILLAVRRAALPLIELRPAAVKRYMTAHGGARKGQMRAAAAARLGVDEIPGPPDVADALAIAMCAAQRGVRL